MHHLALKITENTKVNFFSCLSTEQNFKILVSICSIYEKFHFKTHEDIWKL